MCITVEAKRPALNSLVFKIVSQHVYGLEGQTKNNIIALPKGISNFSGPFGNIFSRLQKGCTYEWQLELFYYNS